MMARRLSSVEAAEAMRPSPGGHVPVLLPEVIETLAAERGGVFVDGTFGAGGYARAILEAADCTVLGIDRDPTAIAAGRALEAEFGGQQVQPDQVSTEGAV